MAQVWTMPAWTADAPRGRPAAPDDARCSTTPGYTAVLGTNCDQTYERYLRVGEQVRVTSALESVVGPKQTGVGEGYFVTTQNTWCVGDEAAVVATMLFRVLKFKPGHGARRSTARRSSGPMVNRDTQFFWEGTAAGELRIQQCNACGALRHPPGPDVPVCHALDRGYVVAAGTRHRLLVRGAPRTRRCPGKELPIADRAGRPRGGRADGRRGASACAGRRDRDRRRRCEVDFDRIDDELTLPDLEAEHRGAADRQPARPTARLGAADHADPGGVARRSPPATSRTSTTTATSRRRTARKDIFLNILTTHRAGAAVRRRLGARASAPDFGSRIALRLGAPAYPYDTLTFTGTVDRRRPTACVDDRRRRRGVARRPRHATVTRVAVARMSALSGKAAIAGIGATEFSKESGRSELQLSVEAVLRALADAGLTAADVDGLVTFTMDTTSEIAVARELGMGELRFFSRINYGGGAACAHRPAGGDGGGDRRRRRRGLLPRLQRALRAAVRPGLELGRDRRSTPTASTTPGPTRTGLGTPAATVAMQARRYMHEYGATSEDFGRVAVADRRHAATNPDAFFYGKPITLEDHQASRMIVDPLHLLDCCQESDGAVAIVVTSAERARDLRRSGRRTIAAAAQGSARGPVRDDVVLPRRHRHPRDGRRRPRAVAPVRARARRHRRRPSSTTTSRRTC